MRQLFIVGVKILGLLCLWWAIFLTLQIISYGGMFLYGHSHSKYWVVGTLLYGVGIFMYFILAMWFALVLLFKTEWVAEKVGLDKEDKLSGWPEEHKLLRLGIILLGFYVLAHAIPGLFRSLPSLLGTFLSKGIFDTGAFITHYITPIFSGILEVAVGLLLIVMPARIIQWVGNIQKKIEYKLNVTDENVEKCED